VSVCLFVRDSTEVEDAYAYRGPRPAFSVQTTKQVCIKAH